MNRRIPTYVSQILALAALPLLCPSPTAAQMAIEELVITSGPAYQNGVFTDFFIDPVVSGFEIAAVQVSLTSGLTIDFVEVDEDEFACDEVIPSEPCEGFASLAEINAIGALTFSVLGESGETDSWVVPAADYMPGSGHPEFPEIVTPGPTESEFIPGSAFVWTTAPVWVDAIAVDLVDVLTDTGVDEALFFGNTTTSWTPTGAIGGDPYNFEVSFVELFFFEDSRTTDLGRDYPFTSGYEAFNRKAVPEPLGAAAWAVTLCLLAVLTRRSSRRSVWREAPRSLS